MLPRTGPPGPSDGPTGPSQPGGGPSGLMGGAPGAGAGGPGGGLMGGPDQDAAGGMKRAIVTMGAEVDRALMGMSEAAQVSSAEFAQARKLVEQGVAKFLASTGDAGAGPPSVSPTEPGNQFPGGGFTSGRP